MKVTAREHRFKGCKLGYKVYITMPFDGRVKYPLKRGYYYTDLNKAKAIERAKAERDYVNLKDYLKHMINWIKKPDRELTNSQMEFNHIIRAELMALQGTF